MHTQPNTACKPDTPDFPAEENKLSLTREQKMMMKLQERIDLITGLLQDDQDTNDHCS